jgi:ascorbate-specific PTS system EIIC-type component UlaA
MLLISRCTTTHNPYKCWSAHCCRRFVGYVFVCAFILINLYVGVIFSQFTRIRMVSLTGNMQLQPDQREWADVCKMVFR